MCMLIAIENIVFMVVSSYYFANNSNNAGS